MVNLSNLKLTGTISPAFAKLTDLRKLYLDDNNLMGKIPEGLTILPELEVVNVSNKLPCRKYSQILTKRQLYCHRQ
ncbi:hypothetical protein Ahy_B09g098155 [Arachis hypogaea]|uniref:Uncharacterized protein n=1 Tax=Arachis hypogaea TaxID=3818 RepID=A0A444XQT8_ARAHY|nr:hypothetical protein Ahy_B09g098155 [Arachis hypogaea]